MVGIVLADRLGTNALDLVASTVSRNSRSARSWFGNRGPSPKQPSEVKSRLPNGDLFYR